MNTAIWIAALVVVGVMLYSRFGGTITLPGLPKMDVRLAAFGGAALAAFYVLYRVHGLASQEVPGYEKTVGEGAGFLLGDPILALSLLVLFAFVVSKWRSRKGGQMAVLPGAASAKDKDDTIGGMPKTEWAFWMNRAPERVAYSYRMDTVRWVIIILVLLAAGILGVAHFAPVPKEVQDILGGEVVVSLCGIFSAAVAGLLLSQVKDTHKTFGPIVFVALGVLLWKSPILWELAKRDPAGSIKLPWAIIGAAVLSGVFVLLTRERFFAAAALCIFFILSLAPNF